MSSKRTITTSLLGPYLDGWADLIEGMGSKAEQVKNEVIKQLNERNMPDVKVEEVTAKPGIFSRDYRDYIVTTTYPGVTTTIYVGNHGNDLYTSWRTYIKIPPNWKLFRNITVVWAAFFIPLIFLILLITNSVRTLKFFNHYNWAPVNTAVFQWLIFAAEIFILLLILAAVFGHLSKKDSGAYLDIGSLVLAAFFTISLAGLVWGITERIDPVFQGIIELIKGNITETVSSFQLILESVGVFIFTSILYIMIFGLFVQRNLFYYLAVRANFFDAEDITAMGLSVHKSILRALDSQGISVDKLRLKSSFTGGRKGEDV